MGITASQATIILRIAAEGQTVVECEAIIAPTLATIRQCRHMLEEEALGKPARLAEITATRQRLDDMEEFMDVTNKIFTQFVGNARSGLTRIVRVLLKSR